MYYRKNCNSLGQFKRSRERMIHCSREARMIPNPEKAIADAAGQPFFGASLIPWIEKHGVTFRRGEQPRKAA